MLKLKLRRIGKKRQPSYRIVVAERRERPQAPGIEDLGWYNPKDKKATLKKERVLHWLKIGAKATPTLHNLLVREGVISGPKIPVQKTNKEGATGEKKEGPVKAEGAK